MIFCTLQDGDTISQFYINSISHMLQEGLGVLLRKSENFSGGRRVAEKEWCLSPLETSIIQGGCLHFPAFEREKGQAQPLAFISNIQPEREFHHSGGTSAFVLPHTHCPLNLYHITSGLQACHSFRSDLFWHGWIKAFRQNQAPPALRRKGMG